MIIKEYKIQYKKSVEKDLRKLPAIQLKPIVTKISILSTNPRPNGSVKLRGTSDLFRIRHSDYRIIYQIRDEKLIILVIKVGHRREIYKDV
ncbi:MAG TPA: type II toxin-antitoxin system RelE/ParE family toxin [Patescibacteria group bacterium]|jgi:mRNA interferase RelE/StbE|nr:type II toxin-antitoxin system RelE/ParE family toxin [Patescibacteria group bacterium]